MHLIKHMLLPAVLVLAACKPDVDVKISTQDIMDAATTNTAVLVDFDAKIAQNYTKIDDKKRAEIESIVKIITANFQDVEVDVEYGSDSFEIEIEGELEITTAADSNIAPWFFQARKLSDTQFELMQAKSSKWAKFEKDLQSVSFMAAPKDFLPVNFKIKNSGGEIYVGGAVLDGQPLAGFATVPLTGSKINLKFEGDHWEKAPASFLFNN